VAEGGSPTEQGRAPETTVEGRRLSAPGVSAPVREPSRIEYEVTADDIARGKPGFPSLCPIARALKRQTGATWIVGAYNASDDEGRLWRLDARALRFIRTFDGIGDAQPFASYLKPYKEVREQDPA
jgi:hypothetical protein